MSRLSPGSIWRWAGRLAPASGPGLSRTRIRRRDAEAEQPANVERFVRRWLGDLIDYDKQTNSTLVATLGQYLEAGRRQGATAVALVVHRSTLKYRLRRIREISGHDLTDPDTCFNLQLASRAWRTLLALRATSP